jgi:hypothetical protein
VDGTAEGLVLLLSSGARRLIVAELHEVRCVLKARKIVEHTFVRDDKAPKNIFRTTSDEESGSDAVTMLTGSVDSEGQGNKLSFAMVSPFA